MTRSVTFLLWVWLGVLGVLGASADDGAYASDLARWQAKLAGNPKDIGALVALGKLCHNRGTLDVPDAADAVDLARKYLGEALEIDPKHAFARALHGSATVLTAKQAWLPTTKISRVRKGIAEMDAALKDSPEDPDARFTRASNNMFLPDLFDRKAVVTADFAWLQERVDQGKFDVEFRQYVCLFHGRAQTKLGDKPKAESLWRAGIAIDPASKVADELRRALDPGRPNR